MAKAAKLAEPQSVVASVIQNQWNDDFKAIGAKMPPAGNNIDTYLWELTVAQFLERLAKTRVEVAKELCIVNGIMPDHKKNPREPGISEQIATGKLCALTLTTKQPAEKFDYKKFIQRVKLMFPEKTKELDKLENECRSTNAVPHTFTSQLIAKD